jgi:hypothetical protein
MALPVNGIGTQTDPYQITNFDEYLTVLQTDGVYGILMVNIKMTALQASVTQNAAEIDYNGFQVAIKQQSNCYFQPKATGDSFTATKHKDPILFIDVGTNPYLGYLNVEGTLGTVASDGSISGAAGYLEIFNDGTEIIQGSTEYPTFCNIKAEHMTLRFNVSLNPKVTNLRLCKLFTDLGGIKIISDVTAQLMNAWWYLVDFYNGANAKDIHFTSTKTLTANDGNGSYHLYILNNPPTNVYFDAQTGQSNYKNYYVCLYGTYSKTVINSSKISDKTQTSGQTLTDEECQVYDTISQYMDIVKVGD